MTAVAYPFDCSSNAICKNSNHRCYMPVLPKGFIQNESNQPHFFQIHYRPSAYATEDAQPPLYFFEAPLKLANSIRVSGLYPRFGGLPLLLPTWLESFLQYLVSLSLALSVLNMVPAAYLDGQHMLGAFVEWLSPTTTLPQKARQKKIVKSAVWACSFLMGVTTLISVHYTT